MEQEFVFAGLDKMVGEPRCELEYETPFELLVAVILSAQCTDKRVNEVTRELFKVANKPEDFVNMPLEELEQRIHSCGFYHNKAKSIKNMSNDLLARFDGVVPNDFEALQTLAGVGRKTANVVISEGFKGDALAVDTHVLRTANRLALVKTTDPTACELELKRIFPKDKWSRLHFQLVLFGRYICKSAKPNCENCAFNAKCPSCKIGVPAEKVNR